MSTPEPLLRPARRGDAEDLARLAELASEGMTSHVWSGMAGPGEDPMAIGARRAARDEGAFSWRNAVLAELGGRVAGGLVCYRIGEAPAPLDGLPAMFRPLQALENRAPGTEYVHILATLPAFRRQGVATRLLGEAARRGAGSRGLSLVVADGNLPARRLYAALGFAEAAREPMVKEGWRNPGRQWLLMLRPV
jgi:ribosomal protein S18 acetylase RimI-like enzyme